MPKGVEHPITIYEIGGIGGDYTVFLPEKEDVELFDLLHPVPVKLMMLDGKHSLGDAYAATITKLSKTTAEIQAQRIFSTLTNLKISLLDQEGNEVTTELYSKVTEILAESPPTFKSHFTAVPPEAEAFFNTILSSQL
jgi:adenylate cyclase